MTPLPLQRRSVSPTLIKLDPAAGF
jgi:hypothetical protein